ncbi:hypothetical protein AB5J03_004414 [Yersinia enterocolitica]|nr:hypothetical protein [Yersinia enterocolitica]EKN3995794.1 hypothetical protein [Yersinia enterocolitica]EKN5087104.1 hypothetical protein [Yersinia enterocolitica]EKN6401296.1 hypothetical protein [Yersinia enterocolitica]EKP3835143.1 hypothetical protein [Yersinia enterocolitica]
MGFDFDQMAYPDVFIISSTEFKGSRSTGKNQIDIPYTDEPEIELGDILIQKIGNRELNLRVVDLSISKNGTLNVGTDHPHLLTLIVENLSGDAFKTKKSGSTFNIGSVSGKQVQIGETNHLLVNVSITELVEKIAKSDDKQAKSMLRQLLENSTVASIVGAGASALLGLL